MRPGHPLHSVPRQSVGDKLRELRRSQQLSQAQLAVTFEVRQQTIGDWERGKRPKPEHFDQLAQYLGVSPAELNDWLDESTTTTAESATVASSADAMLDALMSHYALYIERVRNGQKLDPEENKTLRVLIRSIERARRSPRP